MADRILVPFDESPPAETVVRPTRVPVTVVR